MWTVLPAERRPRRCGISIISSLQGSKLFVLTENADRADAFLRGAAEDLVYTDDFESSEGVNGHMADSSRNDNSSGTKFNGSGGSVSRSGGPVSDFGNR